MVTGSHGTYRWLTTAEHELNTLLRRCPKAVIGKYVAVTLLDSGPMALADAEKWAAQIDPVKLIQVVC